jgi:2-(1,2-epoxy-1,2-dihydrophenyl)acetyl-CoA isomerase
MEEVEMSTRNEESEQQIVYALGADGVATVTLSRPEARNAWTMQMVGRMVELCGEIQRDKAVRAVVLTGAGRSFCAGGDLKAMRDREGMFAGDTVGLRAQYSQGLQGVTRALERLEKPVIAAINGAAIGAGLDLALMCDIRVASERARFGSTFAQVGLIPGDGGAFLLTRAVGFARAVELVLSARVFEAAEALQFGVVHEVVEAQVVLERAVERAQQIAALPAPAVQMAKVALYRSYNQQAEVALQLTAALQAVVQHTEAHEQAVEQMLDRLRDKKK